MENSTKKFLVPIASALASLAADAQALTVESSAPRGRVDAEGTTKNLLAPRPVLKDGDHLATFKRGDELHGLILQRSEQGLVVATHYSHRSHSSHHSHSSHYSSR